MKGDYSKTMEKIYEDLGINKNVTHTNAQNHPRIHNGIFQRHPQSLFFSLPMVMLIMTF